MDGVQAWYGCPRMGHFRSLKRSISQERKIGSNSSQIQSFIIGGQNESRVNAESQTAAPKNQETSRCRSQAGETAGEAGTGGAGGEEGKSEEGKSEERKGQDGKSEKGQADQGGAWQARRDEEEHCGRREKRRVLAFLDP